MEDQTYSVKIVDRDFKTWIIENVTRFEICPHTGKLNIFSEEDGERQSIEMLRKFKKGSWFELHIVPSVKGSMGDHSPTKQLVSTADQES